MRKRSGALRFLGEFIKHPLQLGSIIPSSGYLKRRIVRNADTANAKVIVELGPGNGGTTQAILDSMQPDARLLCIELNEGLYNLVREIDDPRYIAHHGDACDIESILETYNLGSPDVVISGIPFSCMDRSVGSTLLGRIHSILNPAGRFVAYQVNPRVSQLNTFFDANQKTVEIEWLCIPPIRVWRWQKGGQA